MTGPPRLFGTDGIRGAFGTPPLDEPSVRRVGHAIAAVLKDEHDAPEVLLGGDTRESTPELTRWLGESLRGAHCTAHDLGTIPTPGVAFLTRTRGAAAGVVISASHNPFPDNGIKIIGSDGFKVSDAIEQRIEQLCAEASDPAPAGAPANPAPELRGRYVEHLQATSPCALDGMHVVLDTGHGAASPIAGEVFRGLGAEVTVLHDAPDGRNVNDSCGSTAPEKAADAVRDAGADLGFAFDGDADRVILIDEAGTVRDGDEILYLWARELAARGALGPPEIVATSMSNLGLERALASHDIGVVRCDVGDREVVRTLRERRLKLGGEQSGHIIQLDLGTTGDGLLTAVQLAGMVKSRSAAASELLRGFSRFPQLLRNVPVGHKPPLLEIDAIRTEAERIEKELGADGRLVLRYSGTEALARIMLEGPEQGQIEDMASRLAEVIGAALAE